MTKLAVYPGSFDPITNGHLNIIQRALTVFDTLNVAIAINPRKEPLFTVEEKTEMIERAIEQEGLDASRITISHFTGLLVDYAVNRGAQAIVRGLRAVSDFEYEFQMATMNRKLSENMETLFMMTDEGHFYISSQTVKEVASLQGSVEGLVPEYVKRKLEEKFPKS